MARTVIHVIYLLSKFQPTSPRSQYQLESFRVTFRTPTWDKGFAILTYVSMGNDPTGLVPGNMARAISSESYLRVAIDLMRGISGQPRRNKATYIRPLHFSSSPSSLVGQLASNMLDSFPISIIAVVVMTLKVC